MAKLKSTVLIDIRSDSVGGARLSPNPATVSSHLMQVTRHDFAYQAELNHQRFFANLISALKSILNELLPNRHDRPNRLDCFLSAPFYAAGTRTIKQTHEHPVTITESLVSTLVKDDLEKFKRNAPPIYREILHDSHELVEHKVMQLKANRYSIHNPYGKKASELEISHYLSFSSKKVLDRLREILLVQTGVRQINFHSFPFAFYIVSRDFFGSDHVLLLDIGGEVSEVSLIANGILWETVSFPFGRNFLVRQVARRLRTVPEEALSALKLYLHREQGQAPNPELRKVLPQIRDEWLSKFRDSLIALTEHHLGASKILVIGGADLTSIFVDWIRAGSYAEAMFTRHQLEVLRLTGQELKATRREVEMGQAADPYLLLEAIFYDRLMTSKKL